MHLKHHLFMNKLRTYKKIRNIELTDTYSYLCLIDACFKQTRIKELKPPFCLSYKHHTLYRHALGKEKKNLYL